MKPSSRRGAAVVEFALWLPILLMFVSAIVDWGWYMTQRVVVARAAMEGARMGSATFEPLTEVAGSLVIPAANQRASDVLMGLGMACGVGCVVDTVYCADGDGGICGNPPFDGLVLTVTYPYDAFFGFVPTPVDLSEQFLMAVENQREPD